MKSINCVSLICLVAHLDMNKKILIIENDRDIREIVDIVLTDQGYEVADCAHQSVTELQQYTADVIILDEWVLGKKAGHMLCQELKAIDALMHVPVIILSTAHNIEEIACACKADGFVRKPFDIEHLLTEVARVCLLCTSPA